MPTEFTSKFICHNAAKLRFPQGRVISNRQQVTMRMEALSESRF